MLLIIFTDALRPLPAITLINDVAQWNFLYIAKQKTMYTHVYFASDHAPAIQKNNYLIQI